MVTADDRLIGALAGLRTRATAFGRARTRRSWLDERRPAVVRLGRVPPRTMRAAVRTERLPTDLEDWLPDSEAERFGGRAALDEDGRPLFIEDDETVVLWTWDPGFDEELSIRTAGRGNVATGERIVRDEAGAVVGAVGCSGGWAWIQRWRTDAEGRVVRVERAEVAAGDWAASGASEATFDARGRLHRIHRDEPFRRPAPDAERTDEALRSALEGARTLTCTVARWDGRWQRPEELRDDLTGMAPLIADGLLRALRAATRDAGLRRTACIEVGGGGDVFRTLPPRVLVADEDWQAGLHRHRPDPEAIPRLLDDGWRAKDVPELDLVDFADDDTLQACREIETAIDYWSPQEAKARARPVVAAVGALLADALVDPSVVPDPVPSYLALVPVGESVRESVARARRHAGDDAVDRFLDAGGDAPARPRSTPALGELARRAVVDHDRDALRELAAAVGLDAHAEQLADDVARTALIGIPADRAGHTPDRGLGPSTAAPPADDPVRSRVGGPGLLPPGVPWPRFDDRRSLSFVAAIDLSELPAVADGPAWPAEGWLLVYADIDGEPEGDDIALAEVEDNGGRSAARVLGVPAGAAPVAATTDDAPSEVEPTHVAWWPRLTLPDDWAHGAGVDAFAAQAYGQLLGALDDVRTPGEDPEVWEPAMWLRGHAREPIDGASLLLHLEDGWSPGLHLITSSLEVHLPDASVASWDLAGAQLRTVVL